MKIYKAIAQICFNSQHNLRHQGRPQDLGGGPRIFFSDLGICMSRSDMMRMAKPCALLGGFGGMFPQEFIFKRCNLVRFRVYLDQILSLFFFLITIFYKKINLLDTRLLWGISQEEIFENMLRLMRFGVYFETKIGIFWGKLVIIDAF